MKKILTVLFTLLMIISLTGCKQEESNKKLDEIFEQVFDAGTYTSLDYKYAGEYFEETYDKWKEEGGCTVVTKTLDDGTQLIGRNMDLTICNKAAYVFRTKVKGCYETINLAYTFRDISPDYNDVILNGISPKFQKVLPFLADDVLNSEGLYVEVNMRNGETWPTGETKFGCSSTNPDAKERVYLFEFPRYVGEHCATVAEALEYVKTLDFYSMYGNEIHADNYCFLIADATGRYGVMEFACNKMYWHEGQQAQANFYLEPELASMQELKAGVGRYNYVMAGIDAVENEEDMFELIDGVSYYQTYFPDKCKFDNRSEFTGFLPYWTYEYIMKEENREALETVVGVVGDYLDSISRQEEKNEAIYWESIFTEVINCNERTINVRFYEDDSKILKLSFDEPNED